MQRFLNESKNEGWNASLEKTQAFQEHLENYEQIVFAIGESFRKKILCNFTLQQLWCTDAPLCRLQIWTLPGIQQSNLVFQKTLQGSACHLCSYVAPTVAALRMHLKKHKKCSHCSYTSRGVPDIKKHYRDVHNMDYEVTQCQTIK